MWPNNFFLHPDRHAGGQALEIEFPGVPSFWFNEYRVSAAVRKIHYLAVNRRAITGSLAADSTSFDRRQVEIFSDHFMGLRSGVCQITGDLLLSLNPGKGREGGGSGSPGSRAILAGLMERASILGALLTGNAQARELASRLSERSLAGGSPCDPPETGDPRPRCFPRRRCRRQDDCLSANVAAIGEPDAGNCFT